jgi:hypothetical protein
MGPVPYQMGTKRSCILPLGGAASGAAIEGGQNGTGLKPKPGLNGDPPDIWATRLSPLKGP